MQSNYTWFPCGDITLEGVWHLPQGTGPFPGVVVCHPHPFYGGSMQTSVIIAICQALSRQQVAAFRFNFRGVEYSEGSFGGGIAEQEDVKAALSLVLSASEIDSERIGLAGYSFGASVALPVAIQDERVSLLALVSPTLSDAAWQELKACHKAKFLIVGDMDFVAPQQQLQQHFAEVPEPKQYQVVSGADHFWVGYEQEVAQKVSQFFTSNFNLTA